MFANLTNNREVKLVRHVHGEIRHESPSEKLSMISGSLRFSAS